MANPEHLAILEKGVEAWNRWREENPGVAPDLADAALERKTLRKINFMDADLSSANLDHCIFTLGQFTRANLAEAWLNHADLSGVDAANCTFTGARLFWVHLGVTNLSGCDFSNTLLAFCSLRGTKVFETDFRNAQMGACNLGVDLSSARGLAEVEHGAESIIGTYTLEVTASLLSKFSQQTREIEKFLRGAGASDAAIKFFKSMIGQPVYSSVFISYGNADLPFARRLVAALRGRGIRCWFFHEDAKWGGTVWAEIGKGIQTYDRLLVICSEASLKSGPVNREIERALHKEDREGKPVLFPITLDRFLFEGWQHERKPDVLAKVVGDFENWTDEESYKKAFERLLRDLKADNQH